MAYGPHIVVQYNNDTEFKSKSITTTALLIFYYELLYKQTLVLGAPFCHLREFGIKSVCDGPHHPQSQGLVEQGHRTVKQNILGWQNDHNASLA
jgi:hypothetical protein